jgi:methylmalonyl-CoA mutase
MVVVGGVVPPRDHAELLRAGAAAIFGPGTRITAAAMDIVRDLATALDESEAEATD